MMSRQIVSMCLIASALAAASPRLMADDVPRDAFSSAPRWQAPAAADLRAQALAWLAERTADEAMIARAAALWDALPADAAAADLLDGLCRTFALSDERAAALVEQCSRPHVAGPLTARDWLLDEGTPPFERHNLRLYYGRWLAQERLYDEALALLEGQLPQDVVDPAALLFYQGVVHHRLLHKAPGLAAIRQLLDGVEVRPRRYDSLARLMRADLEALEDESLDHISRQMDDVTRRLDLGHAGPVVRKREDDIIAALDKMIEELEQQQQQQQQGGGQGNANRSTNPAQDSTPMGGRGAGETTQRDIGSESGWGDLPPKERQEALQQIGQDFPAHYRDAIEQYFRKIAAEAEDRP